MNVGKKLRKFIFLNVFAMMGMSCYILADTFFISVANGTLGIAALNLTLPVYGLLFAIGSLIGIGSATRYSLCKPDYRSDTEWQRKNNRDVWCAGSIKKTEYKGTGV